MKKFEVGSTIAHGSNHCLSSSHTSSLRRSRSELFSPQLPATPSENQLAVQAQTLHLKNQRSRYLTPPEFYLVVSLVPAVMAIRGCVPAIATSRKLTRLPSQMNFICFLRERRELRSVVSCLKLLMLHNFVQCSNTNKTLQYHVHLSLRY